MNSDILARNSLLLGAVRNLEPAFHEKNINIMLLKGAALLEYGIRDFSEREMSDADILVKKKDASQAAALLLKKGFSEMPGSSNAYFKELKPSFPPLLIDLHSSLIHIKKEEALWLSAVKLRDGVYLPSMPELAVLTIAHAVFHHGFFDEKSKTDLKKIFESEKNKKNLAEKILRKAESYGIPFLVSRALAEAEIKESENLNFQKPLKEWFLSPLLNLAFRKHFSFNEYLLPFLYRPDMGFRLLFPNEDFMRRRYGSASFFYYLKRFFSFPLRLMGIRD